MDKSIISFGCIPVSATWFIGAKEEWDSIQILRIFKSDQNSIVKAPVQGQNPQWQRVIEIKSKEGRPLKKLTKNHRRVKREQIRVNAIKYQSW